ncbi:adhesion G-protein coupled receptor G1 isoform X2 [Limanda limanda]|uniref:adhesion G-protein coupled receptor G1 isoform X2 n=1 Tax=Limanda limanda TaxID=27771 RepID=UPI0029C74EEC|nr:adhesion G-protein coupled receptor G1 isoform X2 [Limanda limanda]
MEFRLTDSLRVVFILTMLLATGSSENDQSLMFCGTWHHGKQSLDVSFNLSPGCKGLSISANKSSLSVNGQITAKCRTSDVIHLKQLGPEESEVCLYWEPLLDQLKLQIRGENHTLCRPTSLQGSCCTDLSPAGPNEPEADYGIGNGRIRTDTMSDKTFIAFKFTGSSISCKDLCNQARGGSTQVNMFDENAGDPCASSFEVEMNDDFRGYNVTSPVTKGVFQEPTATVHLPSALKQAAKMTTKVVCTFFRNNTEFQVGQKKVRILSEVVEITVENEIIIDLAEPIRIDFYHDAIPKMHSRKCVSWDTRKDPLQVRWLEDGCITQQRGEQNTECLCNHLTYFSVLVQLEPRPVRHLLALTVITSLGCAVSVISCVALITFLCRKRRSKEQSIPIHLGLAVSLVALNLLFFFTGVLANVGGEGLCTWVGAGLHYSLLSAFMWMGIEVFHTFWLVYMVFTPSPKPYIWNLVGFVLPAVPIVILAAVGDIYGLREVVPTEDVSNPYRMCWMKDNDKALLAHYFTTMTILVILVLSGIVMLCFVYRKIRPRAEWRQNRVAFLSIWGLSCLFGTSWGLTFLDFGHLSDLVLFLSCILNSFQGFLLMLRFYMLEWMRKQAGGSALGSNSTGSTRQHMLKAPEKS